MVWSIRVSEIPVTNPVHSILFLKKLSGREKYLWASIGDLTHLEAC